MRPAGTLVPGSSSAIFCSSRRARPASSSRALASLDPRGVRLVRLARRLLGVALHRPGEDLRQAGVLEVAGGVAGPPRGPLAGLLHLPLLPLDLLLGVADVLLGDLPRGAHGLLVLGEVPAVEPELAAVEFGDAVHPVEQRPVVADQQQAAVPVLEHVVELVAGVEVEVVGRLVEQQDVGPLQQLRRQAERDDLAAAEGVQAPGRGRGRRGRAGPAGRGCAPRCPSRCRSW